ncbi:MAG TPA: NAD(P)H-dependent oxidoreductase [Polyangiaceae bacterium]|jgi:NAD(P)H-dependent FMN reductase/ketosteroid isomerase-like protein|nr:NAD(P)H-dependent oxidoreductase [Polyangiaceae bacterium]
MTQSIRVAVLVGSLRAASLSRKIAKALIARAPRTLSCDIVEIGELPLYNEDLETDAPPAAWAKFRAAIAKSDAILFVTPEYNRSLPGCLKNALDVGSRPPKRSVFKGLPAGVVSVTPFKLGGFGANHAVRQTFVFLDMPVMQQPEMYIGGAKDLLDNEGGLKDPETAKLFDGFMTAFEKWTRTLRGAKAPPFAEFLETRKQVATDYVNGEAASLDAIVTAADPATFFSPMGDVTQGASAVTARYDKDASSFEKGGSTTLEILQSGASGELAFWTGYQRAEARLAGRAEAAPMALRITEIYRVEGGEYKLVHRHADMGSKPGKKD